MIPNSKLQLLGVNLVVKFAYGWSHGSPRPMNMNDKLIISKSEAFLEASYKTEVKNKSLVTLSSS